MEIFEQQKSRDWIGNGRQVETTKFTRAECVVGVERRS
jgi:hypothetical protein